MDPITFFPLENIQHHRCKALKCCFVGYQITKADKILKDLW